MGIRHSSNPDSFFSLGTPISNSLTQRYQTIRLSDLEQSPPPKSQIVYKHPFPPTEQYAQKEWLQYNSAEELDNLNEYVYFLKNNCPNLDITNLHVPYQITMRAKGMCENMQQVQIYYPYYEYKMKAELQARTNRRQSFHETQIWYLLMSVLNGMRQFERIKCISTEFSLNSIRFNSLGHVKIDNIMASPARMDSTRNERLYWSHKNMVNYYVQETYRLAIVIVEVAAGVPLAAMVEEGKRKERARLNGTMLYSVDQSEMEIQRQIKKALQIIRKNYSQLLTNLLNVMLCHPRDRPLPSQIYQVLVPYKSDIMAFKPFNFNPQTMARIKASLTNSNSNQASNSFGAMGQSEKMGNSLGYGQGGSMYNSMGNFDGARTNTNTYPYQGNPNNDSRMLIDDVGMVMGVGNHQPRNMKYSQGNFVPNQNRYNSNNNNNRNQYNTHDDLRVDIGNKFDHHNTSVDNFRKVRAGMDRSRQLGYTTGHFTHTNNNNNISIYDYREDRRNMSIDQGQLYFQRNQQQQLQQNRSMNKGMFGHGHGQGAGSGNIGYPVSNIGGNSNIYAQPPSRLRQAERQKQRSREKLRQQQQQQQQQYQVIDNYNARVQQQRSPRLPNPNTNININPTTMNDSLNIGRDRTRDNNRSDNRTNLLYYNRNPQSNLQQQQQQQQRYPTTYLTY